MRASQRGVVLVAVLWMVAALTMLVAGLSAAARSEVRGAGNLKERLLLEALADGAILMACRDYAASAPAQSLPLVQQVVLGGSAIEVSISSAAGRVDLNRAPLEAVQGLLTGIGGLPPDDASEMAARIIDWRDPDQASLPAGAEDPDYEAAGVPYRTRGAPFVVPEDLLQVLGMRFEVFDRIRDFVTVAGAPDGLIDTASAPPELLAVLGGAGGEVRGLGATPLPASSGRAAAANLAGAGGGAALRVEARVPSAGGRLLRRVSWLRIAPAAIDSKPLKVLRSEPSIFMAKRN